MNSSNTIADLPHQFLGRGSHATRNCMSRKRCQFAGFVSPFFEQNQARWIVGRLLEGHKHDLVVTFAFITEIMDDFLVAVDDQPIVLRFIRVQDGLMSFY